MALAENGSAAPIVAAADFLKRIAKTQRLLVAVSGGSDSAGLLYALVEAARKTGFPRNFLVACTVDHGLRAESGEEADQVASLCRRLGVEHHIRHWDGEKPATGLMAAARLARYRLLADLAGEIGADIVVTGHTLDDQLETVAMRSQRGNEGRGLSGMAEVTLFDARLWIARPFLGVRREAIRDMLREAHFDWIDDPSNENMRYERVRVRGLDAENIAIEDIRQAGRERAKLAKAAARIIADDVECPLAGCFALPASVISGGAGELALRVLIAVAGGQTFLPNDDKAQRLIDKITSGENFRQTLSRAVIEKRSGMLCIYREARNLPNLDLAAGESGIWDGRFRVLNKGMKAVRLSPSPDIAEEGATWSEYLPKGTVRRILRAFPSVADDVQAQLEIMPHLALFENFLPGFDVSLAEEMAKLTQRPVFPKAPLEV